MERLTPEEIQRLDDRMAQIGGLIGYQIDHARNVKYERYWNYLCFMRNGYKGMHFSIRDEKDRLSVSGEYPKDEKGHDGMPYGENPPKISVSLSKRNEQIVADIKRRFLPAYEALFQKVQERVDRSNEFDKKKRGQIATVAEYLGMEVPKEDEQCLYLHKWGVYRIVPYSENTVKFEVEVDAKIAIKVLEVLKNVNAG
jgi:hypothetical protein